ncbi:MAG: hypothetical protein QOD06_2493 [Candidatus Binatota bacterium]|nr:hypothetical protein [Candidatus Binatota bacterium]
MTERQTIRTNGSPIVTDLSTYVLEPLWEDGEFVLSRGVHDGDRAPLLTFAPAAAAPTSETIARIEHAYSLRGELDSAWAARPVSLVHRNGRPTLLLEDPGHDLLANLVGHPWQVAPFLRVAIGVAAALARLHARGIIHKDVKPPNVLVNVATGDAWLIGFGIASRLPRERQAPEPPEAIAGTLAYMAPEQTGWMNRSVDSRSDLYAFGVTLYEMLTGTLPFVAADPLEWVHCHVARQATPPVERVSGMPRILSDVVMKLLAKTPEERYQTAAGVEDDLRRCLAAWEADGRIDTFALGAGDVSDRLIVPEKLYGREREIDALLDVFARVVADGGSRLVLVSGDSGVGKSSLVNELHERLVVPTAIRDGLAQRTLFASGKVERQKGDIPYGPFAQALQSLVRAVLGKSESELGRWREELRRALGPNGRLVIDLVPQLELVIGEQPPIPDLPPRDSQNRFQTVVRRFLGVFARAEHPLMLFLDDLQWLDAATLDLLEHLVTEPEVRHLLIVGAYRDDDVAAAHPLMRVLAAIRESGSSMLELALRPLTLDDVGALVADTLRCRAEIAAPLAELVHDKTGGNPFFAVQFLTELAEEGAFRFDTNGRAWTWDLAEICARGFSESIADLMVGKLSRLDATTREALKQLASLGHSVDATMLSIVRGTSTDEVREVLWEAVRSGLVFRRNDAYTFVHDRVQEAAYALIPEDERPAIHLESGRRLAAETSENSRQTTIFDVVNQLNRGISLVTSRAERERIAELNLIAGKRAKAATAYSSAAAYLDVGQTLLADDAERRESALAIALAFHRAECEFLDGETAAAEERLSGLAARAASTSDRAAITCLRVAVYTTLNRYDCAVDVAVDDLRSRGIEWPRHPTDDDVREEYGRMWKKMRGRSIEALIDLPPMTDPDCRDSMNVLADVLAPALFADVNSFALVVARMVALSLEHGNCDGSSLAYAQIFMVLGPRFGDPVSGFRFGQLGVDLVERRGLVRFRPRVQLIFGYHVLAWMRHLRIGGEWIRRAFDTAQESGDLTFAGFASTLSITNRLAAGEPLADVQGDAESGVAFAKKTGFAAVGRCFLVQLGLIRSLRGLPAHFGAAGDVAWDEQWFEQHADDRSLTSWYYWVRKLQAHFHAGDHAAALDAAARAEACHWTTSSFWEVAEYHFHAALVRAISCDGAPPAENARHHEALVAHHGRIAAWARHCPENFADRAALVGAELARVEGRELEAERLYEDAIRLARGYGFIQNEALASELAARFHAARGFATISRAYLRNARERYSAWGAEGKVRQIDDLHPGALDEEAPVSGRTSAIMGTPVEHLDLTTMVEASRALSGEIDLERLIRTLMVSAVEHAGAERGLLVLAGSEGLRIEAEAITEHDSVGVRLGKGAAIGTDLPESVLQYVARAHETVLVDDASREHRFAGDEYIVRKRPRSILCLPLLKQAKLSGVLYLENNLAPNVFTAARITVLKVLASQAAISLENARLFGELQRAERTVQEDEIERLTLMEFVPLPIFVLGPDGGYVHANRALLEYTGFELSDARGEEFRTKIAHPDDVERVRGEIRRGIASRAGWEIEARVRGKDGRYRWFLIRYNPLRDEHGRVQRWYGTGIDIEDRKRAEDRIRTENLALREEIDRVSMFEEIVGASPALQAVLSRVSKVAPTESTVLITGETGTGKELIARAIHKRSPRAARAFVSVNCAAIPQSLIASELFGHEKGAFTGALQRRLGRFEMAEGGTLFLDEVGELPVETQIALLRVLQEREFERVGGNRPIQADVRVITATNRDLEAAVAAGTFRSDLYYRLNVFPIAMPALRERQDDIPMLVEYFIDRYASQAGKKIRQVSKKSRELLQSYRWPGNIRELQNVIERSVILCETETFSVDESWLSWESQQAEPASGPLVEVLATQERAMIEAALAESRGQVSGAFGAAGKLGMRPSTLESKIRSLKIDKQRFKNP